MTKSRLRAQNTLSTSIRPSLSTRIVGIAGALMMFSLVGLGLLLVNKTDLEKENNNAESKTTMKHIEPDTNQAQQLIKINLSDD